MEDGRWARHGVEGVLRGVVAGRTCPAFMANLSGYGSSMVELPRQDPDGVGTRFALQPGSSFRTQPHHVSLPTPPLPPAVTMGASTTNKSAAIEKKPQIIEKPPLNLSHQIWLAGVRFPCAQPRPTPNSPINFHRAQYHELLSKVHEGYPVGRRKACSTNL